MAADCFDRGPNAGHINPALISCVFNRDNSRVCVCVFAHSREDLINSRDAYLKKKNCSFDRLIKIKEWVDKNDPGATIIPFSGAFEQKLIEMEPEERKKYLEEHNTTR